MQIIKYPISTEKAVRLMELDNKLTFIVERKATKQDIKKEIEKSFNVKIIKVNTLITSLGLKKAYVKLSKDTPAIDVATKLGIM